MAGLKHRSDLSGDGDVLHTLLRRETVMRKVSKKLFAWIIALGLLLSQCGQTCITVDAARYNNGKPWIDTELQENLSKKMKTDPTDNFHLYASKDWLVKSRIPEGYDSWSHYSERSRQVKNQCIKMLQDDSIKGHDAKLVHTLNKLVLDWDTRNAIGVSEIAPLADQILGIEDMAGLNTLLMSEDGLYYLDNFISLSVSPGMNDSTRNLIYLGSDGLLLGDAAEYDERTEYGDITYNYKKDVFTYIAGKLGMESDQASLCFDNALAFETKLAENMMTSEEAMSDDAIKKMNNEMSFSRLASFNGNYPLTEMIEKMGYRYNRNYIVTEPKYLDHLNTLYTSENLEGIKAVIYVKYVLSFSDILDRATYDYAQDANNKYAGGEGSVPDKEMAYGMVAELLPTAMDKLYVKKYGSAKSKHRMEDMCRQVINTYRKMLRQNKWASKKTIDYAIKKLDSIKIHAAYPDKWMDYSSISLDGLSLIEAERRINEYYHDYNISQAGKKVDEKNWGYGLSLLTCNAFYDPSQNTINMIIGMMGEPFFSEDMSTEELYASLGAFWIGHEVSHAFDSNGAQYDANGNLRNWWSKRDQKEFKKRVNKMNRYLDRIVPFGKYHVKGSNVNTEMIADMTGLQCALKMAEDVDNFDYDKFFKTYARMNASISLYSSELYLLSQDPHPLDYLRTNVPVQQFDEFYETYNVEKNDAMYLAPKDRLIIW